MEVDSHDWEEFESFHGKTIDGNGFTNQLTDSLPKNSACVLLGVTAKDSDQLSKPCEEITSSLTSDLKNVDAHKIIDSCFPAEQNADGKCSKFVSTFSKVLKRGFAMIENDKVWKKVVGNFGTLLPIDWQLSRSKELQETGLKLSENKAARNCEESDEVPTKVSQENVSSIDEKYPNLDVDDDDEEVQQAFDMHSLILSTNVQQEPLFTAEQVISEIEEMMMEEALDPVEDAHENPESFALPPISKKQNKNDEVHYETLPLKKPLIGDLNEMTVLELCELYDELECIVREYSECLIQELARRDELEYDKELKNQFISLFLSLQRKKRAYLSQEKKNKSRSKSHPPIDHASKVYLTTTIPYDHSSGHPSSELLTTYVKILKAMDDESPNLPMLLTEYILKVVCPT